MYIFKPTRKNYAPGSYVRVCSNICDIAFYVLSPKRLYHGWLPTDLKKKKQIRK